MLSRRGHSKAFFSGCHCVAVTGYCMWQTRAKLCTGMHQERHARFCRPPYGPSTAAYIKTAFEGCHGHP